MEQKRGFYWERHADAEKACLDLVLDCKRKNRILARFAEKLSNQTNSRLLDWIDHFYLSDSKQIREKLSSLGFVRQPDIAREAYCHPGAILPTFVLARRPFRHEQGLALRVDSIADFLQANGFRGEPEGAPFSPFRRALLGSEGGVSLMAVERRGSSDYDPLDPGSSYQRTVLEAIEAWQSRLRSNDDEETAFAEMFLIAERLIGRLGGGLAAHTVLYCERAYWLSRNFAARFQHGRHQTMGLGWANHDHYTFRSSRRNFSRLVSLFSALGFRNRERFYAGAEAGWGAQVMEHDSGLVLFLDVDLSPEEVETDFSRAELAPLERPGTVGLWCGLHGDSILQAGMHHLAARFEFDHLITDLARYGVHYMPPFSNSPYLKQAFSVAERWHVDPVRLNRLVRENAIGSGQAEMFLSQGAVGSHLENIERGEGYKGFNKKNVSAIIRDTDPRRNVA